MESALNRKYGTFTLRQQRIIDYFDFINCGKTDELLNLFSEEAVIDEPFSKSLVVGKLQIEMFLNTVIMANTGMQADLEFPKSDDGVSPLIAFVSFIKSSILKGKFTFEFNDKGSEEGKIKSLKIEFIE